MKLRTLVVALIPAGFFLTSIDAHANAEWTNQPSWAVNRESAHQSRRTNQGSKRDERPDVRPFTPGSHNLAVDLGQVFLMGNLGSDYADNIGAQVHYTYGVSEMFAFDSSFGRSSHGDGDYSQMMLLAGLRTNLAWYDKVIPHLNFGLGFYKPSHRFHLKDGGSETASPVLFGVHLGPGVDLELTRDLFFGASLTFHDMFGKRQLISSLGEKPLGGTYTSFFLRAGVTF